jgi:hypothetical protein
MDDDNLELSIRTDFNDQKENNYFNNFPPLGIKKSPEKEKNDINTTNNTDTNKNIEKNTHQRAYSNFNDITLKLDATSHNKTKSAIYSNSPESKTNTNNKFQKKKRRINKK